MAGSLKNNKEILKFNKKKWLKNSGHVVEKVKKSLEDALNDDCENLIF